MAQLSVSTAASFPGRAALSAASGLSARAQIVPVINNVKADTTAKTITGTGFNLRAKPRVSLGGTYLTVTSSNLTTIVANLGSVTASGTFLLTVFGDLLPAAAYVTSAAAGPQGPIGPTGAQGATGAQSPMGVKAG